LAQCYRATPGINHSIKKKQAVEYGAARLKNFEAPPGSDKRGPKNEWEQEGEATG